MASRIGSSAAMEASRYMSLMTITDRCDCSQFDR